MPNIDNERSRRLRTVAMAVHAGRFQRKPGMNTFLAKVATVDVRIESIGLWSEASMKKSYARKLAEARRVKLTNIQPKPGALRTKALEEHERV